MDHSDEGRTIVTTKAEGKGARLTVKLSMTSRTGEQSLKEKYGVTKYDLGLGYNIPVAMASLVPKNVSDFVDEGENYVERLMRSLYYFKQCALIGPSGTGKSVCAGEPVYVITNGRPSLTTVENLFEELSRSMPVATDEDGWQTILLNRADVRILSMDASEAITWKRPYAIARSIYRGDVVRVTTTRNRTLRATPDHSFVSEGGVVGASKLKVGTMIPILRRIPHRELLEKTEVCIADYVEGARVTGGGVVVGGDRIAIQIPAPLTVRLDEQFAWFLGFFVAEGYIGKGFASIYNKAEAPLTKCTGLLKSLGVASSRRQQRGLIEIRAFSKAFVSFLSKVTVGRRFGTGKGSQARYKKVPEFLFSAGEGARLAFLRGFFDGDGWVEEDSELVMGTSSKELAQGLLTLYEESKIFPTIRIKTGKAVSYCIAIGRDDAKRLGVVVGRQGRATDYRGHVEKIRISSHMLAAAKAAYQKLPLVKRSKRFHKRTVGHFYSRTGFIGLNTLLRIASDLRSEELKRIATGDLLWDSVKDLKRETYDGWVYDFQVPGSETFVAGFGGVVTHNTHIVYLVAKIAGLPLWEINCGLQTSVYDMFGRFVGLGKENWIDGQIVSWCRYGGILYLDEANMMKQDIATRLNPLLDTRGHLVLTEKDNEIIPRSPFGYVVISMNPFSSEFAGTKPLNAAFRRRMSVWIDFDYLSVGAKISQREIRLLAERAEISTQISEKIVRVAAEIRKRYKNGDLPYAPSVGDLVNWATLVSDGLTPQAASEETIVSMNSDDPEVQANVRRIVEMVLGPGEKVRKAEAP